MGNNDATGSATRIDCGHRGYAVHYSGDKLSVDDRARLGKAFKAGLPALLVAAKGRNTKQEKDREHRLLLEKATGCSGENILLLNDLVARGGHFRKLRYFPYDNLLKGSLVAVKNADELLSDEPSARGLTNIFLEQSGKYICQVEHECWTLLVDETGCFDELSGRSAGLPSMMMALVKPPGVTLPPAPIGFHSVDKSSARHVPSLRDVIDREKQLAVVGMGFGSGKAAGVRGRGVTGDSLHSRMWRTMLIACLELVAGMEAAVGDGTVHSVHVYMEETSGLEPSKKYFDSLVGQLLGAVGGRRGWNTLRLLNPLIIPKDTHPWLAYPDALGLALRASSPDTRFLPPQRKNSYMMEYIQEASVCLESVVMSSGNNPGDALNLVAGMPEEHILALEPVFDAISSECFSRLEGPAAGSLAGRLVENLVKSPSMYFASNFLCSRVPERLLAAEKNPELVFLLHINRLIAANHHGDEGAAEEAVRSLESMKGLITNLELRYKFMLGRADYQMNCLRLHTALDEIKDHVSEAKERLGIIPGAAHLLSQYAQFLAFNRQQALALSFFNELDPMVMNPSERERLHVYRAHATYDAGDLAGAVRFLERAVSEGWCGTPAGACANSQYLRCAMLKVHAARPFLSSADLEALLELPVPSGFPGVNIAYWALACGRQAGFDVSAIVEYLGHALADRGREKSDALELINACFADQLTADGVLPGKELKGTAGACAERRRVAEWIRAHPQETGTVHGKLAPLLFYFR